MMMNMVIMVVMIDLTTSNHALDIEMMEAVMRMLRWILNVVMIMVMHEAMHVVMNEDFDEVIDEVMGTHVVVS